MQGKYDNNPIYSLYLSFGKYPQTLVTDKKLSNILDTIEDTNDEGYIKGINVSVGEMLVEL